MGSMPAAFIAAHAHADDADLARALVEHAGGLALRMRDDGLSTDVKTSVSDVVTDADRAAENFVAQALEALRPEDGVVGEEGASRASSSGRTWVIDPVDGTYNFSRGSDYFCSALALVEGAPSNPDKILVGAVHRPAQGSTWVAARGRATHNGSPLPQLEDARLEDLALATYLHPRSMKDEAVRAAWTDAVRDAATIRMWGAGSVDLATVAAGGIGGWLQHSVADWDWLPGKALVEAAGGVASKVEAGGVVWCVAGNRRVVADVTARLANHV
ncbi:inositol monophosphatase family protein [Corynebacterium qintianiae]|uniref:Inositol monophosphatase family protein n=1 Tax=Corynebacterium qintianiae TaxID=2709392 RepID=A0A7T0PGD9_9CORY|nr:inositol monophosphatase family protein [Corynebacterium qintianiae]QPK83747.1 inositol monophosphatase family protein [Corynebacterium qintianiae]